MNRIIFITLVWAIICSLWVNANGEKSIRRLKLNPGMAVNMTLGYPAQQFSVALNTGSATTWVVGKHCQSSYCRARANLFDSSLSASFIRDDRRWHMSYGIGVIFEGSLARDTLGLAGGFVGDQLVGELERTEGWMADHLMLFDGVLGLGSRFSPILNTLDAIQSMFRQQVIPEELFSLYVTNKQAGDEQLTGELILGGIEPQYFSGDINYVPIISRWSFYVDYMTVPGSDFMFALRSEALIDSSSNVILAPMGVVRQIILQFGALFDDRLHLFYFLSCDRIPDLHFDLSVDGAKLSLSASDLVIKLKSGRHSFCYLALDINKEPGWLLGTPFLRKYYTIFDYAEKRLGFALSKVN